MSNKSRSRLMAAGVVYLVVASCAWGLFVGTPASAVVLAILSSPIVISVGAAAVACVYYLLPVAKVPLTYNLRNLQVRWKTTVITAMAFTLVVALLTVMLAFVMAMDRMTDGSAQPGNVMVMSDGATDEIISNLPEFHVTQFEYRLKSLIERDEAGKLLFSMEVYVILNHQLPHAIEGGRQRRFVQVRGLVDAQVAAGVHGLELAAGRWWSSSGVRRLDSGDEVWEAVIGDGLAKTFGLDKGTGPVGIGEILDVSGQKWYVVGVTKETASAFGSEIWAKASLIMDRYGRKNAYSTFVFRTKDADTAKEAAGLVKEQRQGRGFVGLTETAYYARLNETNAQFLVAFIFVAVIMAVGGVLGVMNTMFAAISQRSKDIGVLRILGFSRWQILMSFLLESVLISLVGGLAG